MVHNPVANFTQQSLLTLRDSQILIHMTSLFINHKGLLVLKFIYSEKATKFCEISTLLLTGTTKDKSKLEISKKFVAFSDYMNFKKI